jgi:hypothetical protein
MRNTPANIAKREPSVNLDDLSIFFSEACQLSIEQVQTAFDGRERPVPFGVTTIGRLTRIGLS